MIWIKWLLNCMGVFKVLIINLLLLLLLLNIYIVFICVCLCVCVSEWGCLFYESFSENSVANIVKCFDLIFFIIEILRFCSFFMHCVYKCVSVCEFHLFIFFFIHFGWFSKALVCKCKIENSIILRFSSYSFAPPRSSYSFWFFF